MIGNERNMKDGWKREKQEKYQLITQEVLNPKFSPCGSKIAFYSFLCFQNLQNVGALDFQESPMQ